MLKVNLISGHGTTSIMIPQERQHFYIDVIVWENGKEVGHSYFVQLDGEGKPMFTKEKGEYTPMPLFRDCKNCKKQHNANRPGKLNGNYHELCPECERQKVEDEGIAEVITG